MKKAISALAIVLALSGCASSGVYVDEAAARSFTKGKSTVSDVVEKLGAPTNKTINSSGKTEIRYDYVESQTRPESFIPYVGLAVGGTDVRVNTAIFTFNSKGVLTDYSYTSNETGVGTGFASGSKYERVENQPRK